MRRIAAIAACTAFAALWLANAGPLAATGAKEIRIDPIPETVDAFLVLRNRLATTPEGGAAIFLTALLGYTRDKALGRKFLTIALDRSELDRGDDYKGFSPGRGFEYHLGRFKPHWPWAYLKGARKENGYKVAPPYVVVVSRNRFSGDEASGRVKVFVHVAGARPRPVTMRRNAKGLWKASLVSSFFLGSPLPKEPDDL